MYNKGMEIEITKTNTKRAKDRVHQHGKIMMVQIDGFWTGQPAFLLRSMEKTSRGETWLGWIEKSEIEWRTV